ncbi:hypothetical protein Tco_0209441 [Tanacetum coccineum]
MSSDEACFGVTYTSLRVIDESHMTQATTLVGITCQWGDQCNPEYFAPSNEEVLIEEQPYAAIDSPICVLSEDDADDEDEEEASKEEEEEHLALANSIAVASLVVDHVPSAEETEPFETDEFAATPPPPPVYRTTTRMSIRAQTPISFMSEAEVDRLLAIPTLPSSLLTLLSSPLPRIPSPPFLIPSPPTK